MSAVCFAEQVEELKPVRGKAPWTDWVTVPLALLFVLGGLYWAFNTYVKVPRTRDVTIRMDGEWMTGEIRDCVTLEVDEMSCGPIDNTTHKFPVTFHGDHKPFQFWSCQRRTEGLDCEKTAQPIKQIDRK